MTSTDLGGAEAEHTPTQPPASSPPPPPDTKMGVSEGGEGGNTPESKMKPTCLYLISFLINVDFKLYFVSFHHFAQTPLKSQNYD